MAQITTPAVRIEQDGKTLFLTRFTVAELTLPGFYRVEELVAGEDAGYQRKKDKRRARRFAKYIDESGKSAFLPTSILLATSDSLDYDTDRGEITFEVSGDNSRPRFFMVDGQHRAAGLKEIAARSEDSRRLRDFSVPAIVATELDDAAQMVQFLVVNSTQKKVSDDIAQQILAQFTREHGVADMMPYLPKHIRDRIEFGADDQALNLVRYLNESEKSPWLGKIQMANEAKNATTAKQSTLVKSLKAHILKNSHPVALETDKERQARMLENYWRAIVSACLGQTPDAESETGPLFKTTGFDIFHEASMAVFQYLSTNGLGFTESAIRECFKAADEYLPEEFSGIFHPDLWKKGGAASGMNKSVNRKYANALSEAVGRIHKIDNPDIQV